jgi:hypothetical protein
MPLEPTNSIKQWEVMVAYIRERLKTENPFEIEAERFQNELKLSDGFHLTLQNAREGGMPRMFEMQTLSASGNRQHFKFWT